MAWHMVEHECGHSVWTQIYGPSVDRPGKREWLAERPCRECQR